MMMALHLRRIFGSFGRPHHGRRGMRDMMMADIAHELQTPLAILRGHFEALRRNDMTAAERALAERVIASTLDGMVRLVQGSLERAKMESSASAVATEDISLEPLLREVAEDCAILAEEKGIALTVRAVDRMPSGAIVVRADRGRIKEVLFNLISNAFKHTPPGGAVALSVERMEGVARVAVRDSGTGIPPAELPHIFERFYRMKGDEGAVSGTGIGLDICRAIVEAHGGRIGAESEAGKGSRFIVSLPLAPSCAAFAPACPRGAVPAEAAVSAIMNV